MMNESVTIAVSKIADGSMSAGVDEAVKLSNRRAFLSQYGITAEQTVLVHLSYDSQDFRRYYTVSSAEAGDGIVTPSTIIADALFTTDRTVALLLPVADCIGVVLYDQTTGSLGLAHLGRHNLLQDGGRAVIEYMVQNFGSQPMGISIYLSPAAGREQYPLYDFNNRSLHEVAIAQLESAGVRTDHITQDFRDTTIDPTLFSHSEFLKGNRQSDGRQAVVCMMRPVSE